MSAEVRSTADAGDVAAQVASDAEDLEGFGVQDVPWASVLSGLSTHGFESQVKANLTQIHTNQNLILSALKDIQLEIHWSILTEQVTDGVNNIQSHWDWMNRMGKNTTHPGPARP